MPKLKKQTIAAELGKKALNKVVVARGEKRQAAVSIMKLHLKTPENKLVKIMSKSLNVDENVAWSYIRYIIRARLLEN